MPVSSIAHGFVIIIELFWSRPSVDLGKLCSDNFRRRFTVKLGLEQIHRFYILLIVIIHSSDLNPPNEPPERHNTRC